MIPNDALAQLAGYLRKPSAIYDHGKPCCRATRSWLRGVDVTNSYRAGDWHPPTWLRRKYEWGPVIWPIYWCSIPGMEKLDCGALAAVAAELFRLRGTKVTAVQLALRYPNHATEQWCQMWGRQGIDTGWINTEFCYHEACGIIEGQALRVWDPTESRWLSPPSSPADAFASVVALRITEYGLCDQQTFIWDGIRLGCGEWHSLVFDPQNPITTLPRAVSLNKSD